jgi:putative hemolysin
MNKSDEEIRLKNGKRLECFVTDSETLIKEAQALRFRVFAKEMGAKLKTESESLDYDEVDSYCDHLIVYDNVKGKNSRLYPIAQPTAGRTIRQVLFSK